jgi:chorismate-pyruvate lyase
LTRLDQVTKAPGRQLQTHRQAARKEIEVEKAGQQSASDHLKREVAENNTERFQTRRWNW